MVAKTLAVGPVALPPEPKPELHAGLIAFLGAVVTTVVFTIGFVSHRSHNALIQARDRLRRPTGDQPEPQNAAVARDTVERAQSYLVLAVNLILVVVAVVAAVFAWPDGGETEDAVTLVGFGLLMVMILVLGFHDHGRVRKTCNDELEKTNEKLRKADPAVEVRLLRPPHEALWAELTGRERRPPDNGM
jgi:hypothetical protein